MIISRISHKICNKIWQTGEGLNELLQEKMPHVTASQACIAFSKIRDSRS